MGKADANTRINLAAPLRSVRRNGGAYAEATAVPAYKPGEPSGPVGHTGTVPFQWEQRPGHPKSVRTRRPQLPPPTTTAAKAATSPTRKQTAIARVEEERCSDARPRDDVVSCVTVNCSATGLSDAARTAAPGTGNRGSAMMDRFLSAAHAVAVASPLSTFRKAGSVREPARPAAGTARAGTGDRSPMQRRLALQQVPTEYLQLLPAQGKNVEDDDDADSDVHSTHGFASKKCGLLPTRCVKSTLRLLNPAPAMRRSCGARRGEGGSLVHNGGGSQRETNPLLRSSRKEQQQPRHAGGHDSNTLSWEELYIKSLLRSVGGGRTGPATAVASELDRTVRELYKYRKGETVQPKASHLGLLLVLDSSNEQCHGSSARNATDADETALLLPRAKRSPNAGKKLRWRSPADDAGGYGFPLLLEDRAAAPGREIVLSPRTVLPLPLPKSPSESWLSRALPSLSSRPPPATSFLGLHMQCRKHAPLP